MKRFHEYTEMINESLMMLLVYSAIVATMVQDAKQERLKFKIEQKRMEKELKEMEGREDDEEIQRKLEKERHKRELAQERHDRQEDKWKRNIAKMQMLQDRMAESREKKLETQRFALAAHNMMNDKETAEDRSLIEKHAKNREKCSPDQIRRATEKANKISDEEADKYVAKYMPKKELPETEPESKKETPKKTDKNSDSGDFKMPKKPDTVGTGKEVDKKPEPKEEEVVNPETGKKEKHKVYTGKRGGRYWMSKNNTKVYVKEDKEEQEEASRWDITNSRLAYLQWVIDNTKDKEKSNKLQEMYNALYNITYDTGGDIRSLDDTISYITQTMQNNKGLIPGLPSNDQIEEIDKKAASFKELHPEEYESYIKRLESSNLDKSKKDKEDQADSVLSPADTKDDKDARDKLATLTSIFGFTNIIGLEPNRKPSAEDIKKKSELKKDQKDNALLQDTEDEETALKKPETSGEESGEESSDESGEESSDESDEELSDIEEDMIMYVVMMAEEYLDQFEGEEYDEADVDKWLDEQDLESDLGIETDEEKKGFRDAMKQEIKNELESESDEGGEESGEQTTESLLEFSQNFIFELFGRKDAFKATKKNAEMFNKYGDGAYKPEVTAKELQKARKKNANAVKFNKAANLLTGPLGAAIINKKQDNMKKRMAGMKSMIDSTQDPDEKEKLQKNYDMMMKACVTKKGRFRARPKLKNLSPEERAEFKSKYKEIKQSKTIRQAGKDYMIKHEDFADQVLQDKISKKKEEKEIKKGNVEKTSMDDGSTLVARKSERDGHMIYTREKGGKTVEYMDKDEYQKRLASKKESVEHHFGSFKALLESKNA